MNSPTPRRTVIKNGILCLAGFSTRSLFASEESSKPLFRIGMVTDLHYADKDPVGTRFYKEALEKLDAAVAFFNQEKATFVVELGDFIDLAPTVEIEIEWLKTMEKHFSPLTMPRHYVLGNHCCHALTKEEFVANTGANKDHHYSFEQQGIRFIILDACFRSDGVDYQRKNFEWSDANIPTNQLQWLQKQLEESNGPVIILAHQRLDGANNFSVKNSAEVRKILEKSGKVLAVFQGHSHKNDYLQIAGIHYCTLVAMIEGSGKQNSGYTLLDIMPDHSLRLHGFLNQTNREFTNKVPTK